MKIYICIYLNPHLKYGIFSEKLIEKRRDIPIVIEFNTIISIITRNIDVNEPPVITCKLLVNTCTQSLNPEPRT